MPKFWISHYQENEVRILEKEIIRLQSKVKI